MALFTRLLFKMLPKVDGMTTYADQLLMYDNLDRPFMETFTPEVREFLKLLPLKVHFTTVILCVEGRVDIKCNMKDLSIKERGLAVIPSGSNAEKLDFADNSTVIVIVVPNSTFAPPAGAHNSVYSASDFTSPLAIEMEHGEMLQGISVYRLLKDQLNFAEHDVNSDLVKAYVMLMAGIAAVSFQRWKARNRKDRISAKEQIYRDFLNCLSEYYREHRDVAFYASCANLTPKYFASVIYECSGNHPLDMIKEQVVLDAQSLLKQGYSIVQVCEALHFTSQSQFTNYFKAAVGVPPGEFLKNKGLISMRVE